MTHPDALRTALAPFGALRVTINYGNPILAHRDAETGELSGVSVDLARALAERLDLPLTLVPFESAGKAVAALNASEADVGFFARDPARAEEIAFTAPYVLIEGSYLVKADSPIRANEEVDRTGVRVTVGKGSAYDLFLTRALKHAAIERAPTSPAVVQVFLDTQADVAAGVRRQLEQLIAHRDDLRLLDGRFMVIEQAMGVRRAFGDAAAQALAVFVEDAKRDGWIADALARHGVSGATVAPPADPAA
ncbi:transporter substrate-binding domain-containing protein [Brevundimonas sp.]|jgi:polar amino acid transport system substrate-binding protein|uniref:transporter substrate-binding domain-containing protein n=1 Tax=Brevundimonas sp. TaxID=1871086 RepID=UPI0037C09F29